MMLAALLPFAVLGSQFSVVDPSTYVGNVYGHVSAANVLVSIGDRVGRTDANGDFLISGIPAPYDGRDYTLTIANESYRVHVLPGAAMALEVNAELGVRTEWHYRHEMENRELRTANYTRSIFATREGLVGGTTANGHVIVPNDRFAALPSRRALSTNFGHEREVRVSYRGRTTVVPVWDIGPWNTHDDYWNPLPIRETFKDLPRGKPEAEAAFFDHFNNGLDERGRVVRTPAGIDLADGTFLIDLGLTNNDFVDVEYLWLDSEGPIVTNIAAAGSSFIATVSDASPIETAEYSIDGSEPIEAPVSGSVISALLPPGTHTISVRARDVYGNWGAFATAVVTIEPHGPLKRRAVRR